MSDTASINEIRHALAFAAQAYQPVRRTRFAKLVPFKAEIQALRKNRASFQTIAEILKKHSISVSHEMVRRFCREIIEQTIPKREKKRRKPTKTTGPGDATGHDETNSAQSRSTSVPASVRGPRIARVEDL